MRTGLDAKRKLFALQNVLAPRDPNSSPTASCSPRHPLAPSGPPQGSEGLSPHPVSSQPPSSSSPSSLEVLRNPQEDERQLGPRGFWCQIQAAVGWHHDIQHIASPTSGTSRWDDGMK